MEQFLDRASAQVDNYTANEANKVYVLVLIALFERQLRIWAQHILDAAEGPKIPTMRFQVLLGTLAERQGIDVAAHALGINLVEAFLVGNVVRHGDGPSSAALSAQASMMWDRSQGDYFDILTPDSPGSEWLRVRSTDLTRYVVSIIRFWGLADRQACAITEYAGLEIPWVSG